MSKKVSPKGHYELHQMGCSKISGEAQIDHLGNLFSCHAALFSAKKLHENVNGCPECTSECYAEDIHVKDMELV